VIDGVLDLANAHDVKPNEVKRVAATVGVAQASMLRNHAPATGLEAKFSLEFAVVSALVARKVGRRELSDEFVARLQVRETMKKVTTATVDTQCPVEPTFSLTDRVMIELADGRQLDSGEIRFARGNAKLPLKPGELEAKFMDCAGGVAGMDAGALYERLERLETVENLRSLPVYGTFANG
jgi:2-methylcitrate dehydratase PrpD